MNSRWLPTCNYLSERWEWWSSCRFPQCFKHIEELLLITTECKMGW